MTRRASCSLGAGRGSRGEGGREKRKEEGRGEGKVETYICIAGGRFE